MKRSAVECSLLRAKAMAFKKRKDTVKKKAMELGTLCDVAVAAIILGPNGEVETYPENQTHLKAVLHKYKDQYKAIASHNIESSSSSADSLIALMNQLNAKIAAVDNRIELLKNISAINVQSCSGGIGVQELLAQGHWLGINGAVDQGLVCGLNPSWQNLGPDDYAMVQDVVPIQAAEHAAAYPATSLGCEGNAAACTSATSLHEGVANSTTAGCESFGYADDCFLDNVELWDHDEQQLHVLDDADDDDGIFDFLLDYFNQEPVVELNSSA